MLKWLFLVLFILNVVLAGGQWMKYRATANVPTYKEGSEVNSIKLLQDELQRGRQACVLIGPFENQQSAAQLLTVLQERGVVVSLVEQSLDRAPSYWVYDGPFDEPEVLQGRLAEYTAKSIDSFPIRQGELAGSISVGVFENIDSAERMINIMAKKGYAVKMRPMSRSGSAFWLSFSAADNLLSWEEIQPLFKGLKGIPETRQIFCKSVASPK